MPIFGDLAPTLLLTLWMFNCSWIKKAEGTKCHENHPLSFLFKKNGEPAFLLPSRHLVLEDGSN